MFLSKCLWQNLLLKAHRKMKPPTRVTSWFSICFSRMIVLLSMNTNTMGKHLNQHAAGPVTIQYEIRILPMKLPLAIRLARA
jgi:hypothetical protein